MKKIKMIIPVVFLFLLICATPIYASSGKIHSLSLSTLSTTKNSQETFYWLMRNNKLSGYSNSEKDQHAYYSEAITTTQFETLLNNAFGNSKDNDLNFFYFTGHTIFKSIDPISGPLGINLNVKTTAYYSFKSLAQKLNSYKGEMVVILDTCGSEAFITDGINSLSNSSCISAICSCGYLEESESGYSYLNPYLFVNGYRYNTFTYALGKGLGFFDQSKKLLADSNNNGSVSIQELFQYTRNNINSLKEMNVRMFSKNASSDIFSYGTKGISIKLSETSVSLYKGKSKQLYAKVTGTNKKPSWTSSNKSVASVDSSGKITAKKSGNATITCKIGNKKVSCKVTVKNPVKIKLSLNRTQITVYTGKTATLKATITGTSAKIKWKSSNYSIASVNSSGKITGKKAGTCKITATANGKSATCTVIVKNQTSANSAYRKLIQKYESKYGKAKLYSSVSMHYWKGVCFAKLLDFDNDGTKELVLAYQNGYGKINKIKYHVELWTFDGKKAKKICSSVSWSGNNCEYFGGFSIIKSGGKYLLFLSDGAVGNDVYYGKKSNGTWGAVHEFHWKGDAMEGQWYYNGKAISVIEYQNYHYKFNQNRTAYGFSDSKCDNEIKNEILKTKKTLKMKYS